MANIVIRKESIAKAIQAKSNDDGACAVVTTESGKEAYTTDLAIFDEIEPGDNVVITLSLGNKEGNQNLFIRIGCEKAAEPATPADTAKDELKKGSNKTEPESKVNSADKISLLEHLNKNEINSLARDLLDKILYSEIDDSFDYTEDDVNVEKEDDPLPPCQRRSNVFGSKRLRF